MVSFLRGALIALLALVLVACSANSRIVRVYDGTERPISQVSRVIVPGDIQLVEIDGIKQQTYLLENISITYELTPGKHRLVYRYSSIWSLPGASVDSDEPKVETIESPLRELVWEFRAGEVYTLDFKRPEDRAEAQQFAAGFSASLITENGRRVTSDAPHRGGGESVALASVPPTPSVAAPAVVAGAAAGTAVAAQPGLPTPATVAAPVDGNLSRLDALKVMWSQANAEEKREFLRWAFQ